MVRFNIVVSLMILTFVVMFSKLILALSVSYDEYF